MNSGWSNDKLRGQMIMEFYEFVIRGKLMKQGIQLKPESSDSDLISKRYPYFKISKNSNQIWIK